MKILLLLIFLHSLVLSAPAHKDRKEFTNNDRSSFRGYLKGDEWFSWVQTQDGYVARYNSDTKDYEYMLLNEGDKLIYSNVKVRNPHTRSVLPSQIKKISSDKLGQLWQKAWENRYKQY